jgi:hypothetical protein
MAILLLDGCVHTPVEVNVGGLAPGLENMFFLEFDTSGRLLNPAGVWRLTERLRLGDIDRLVVQSYGWNSSLHDYSRQIHGLEQQRHFLEELAGDPSALDREVVVYAMWDSSSQTVERLLTDVTPFPTVARAVAKIPDLLLLPLTYWPKAAMATRIAHGDLHDAIESAVTGAFDDLDDVPPIYLAGRSFGCRLVTSLASSFARDREKRQGPSDEIVIADHIGAILLIQPAMSEADLRSSRRHHSIPTVVTFSRHDRANGVLFPVAAIFSSMYWHERFPPLRNPTPVEERTIPNSLWWEVRGGLREDHLMDTLAVIPLIQIPVHWWDESIRDPSDEIPNWGDQGKGLFSLGARFDSVGRERPIFSIPGPAAWSQIPHIWTEWQRQPLTIQEVISSGSTSENRWIDGVLYVDATNSINRNPLGIDMNNTWARFTIDHLSIMGAHEDMVPDERDVGDPNRANVMKLRQWLLNTRIHRFEEAQ